MQTNHHDPVARNGVRKHSTLNLASHRVLLLLVVTVKRAEVDVAASIVDPWTLSVRLENLVNLRVAGIKISTDYRTTSDGQ